MEVTQRRFLSESSSRKLFLLSNLVTSFGILLTTVGGGWDITNHLLNKPETFFAPPHMLLYTGVAIALIGTAVMFSQWHKMPQEQKSRYSFAVKIGLIGIFVLVMAGPIDFVWHSNFGLDGLLSPPHQILISGMFLCATSAMISILRFGKAYENKSYSMHHFFVILAMLSVWMVSSGFMYSFSLPFSDTDYFDFNPEVHFAAVFATISLPFLNSAILMLSAKLASYKFGILSITGILLLVINMANSIMPNPALIDTIPFYLLTIIPFVAADVILSLSQKRIAVFSASAIVGSTFFFLYYPLVTHVYNEVIYNRVVSGSITSNVYFEMLPVVFPMIIGPAVIMGIIGTRFADKVFSKIQE